MGEKVTNGFKSPRSPPHPGHQNKPMCFMEHPDGRWGDARNNQHVLYWVSDVHGQRSGTRPAPEHIFPTFTETVLMLLAPERHRNSQGTVLKGTENSIGPDVRGTDSDPRGPPNGIQMRFMRGTVLKNAERNDRSKQLCSYESGVSDVRGVVSDTPNFPTGPNVRCT